jgi:hypothetical protein
MAPGRGAMENARRDVALEPSQVEWHISQRVSPARDDRRWRQRLREVRAFRRLHGHCDVPRFYGEAGLGQWVNNQRTSYRMSRLSPDRERALRVAGFHFDKREADWEKRLAALRTFKRKHGHCWIPKGHPLRPWVMELRGRGTKRLTPSRRQALEAIGFFTPWRQVQVRLNWERFSRELARLRKARGDLDIVEADVPSRALWWWIRRQRAEYARGTLAPERQRALERLGLSLRPLRESWERRFRELLRYRARHGNCEPPLQRGRGGLGEWVHAQRVKKLAGKLLPERTRRLEALGFRWRPKAEAWDEMHRRLVAFRAKHGHVLVPTRRSGDAELSRWVVAQRSLRNRGRLTEGKRRRLEELSFVWNAREVAWEEQFAKLRAFHQRYGHTDVPKTFRDGKLALWVRTQRAAKSDKTLRADRRRRLDALSFSWRLVSLPIAPGDVEMLLRLRKLPKDAHGQPSLPAVRADRQLSRWLGLQRKAWLTFELHPLVQRDLHALGVLDAERDDWDEWFERLESYLRRHGHLLLPIGSPLSKWLATQRRRRSRGLLFRDRADRLAALEGD